jgi:hypothetical protein
MVLAPPCGRLAMTDPLRSKLGVVRVPPKGIKGGRLIFFLIPFGESKAWCGFQGGVVVVCVCVLIPFAQSQAWRGFQGATAPKGINESLWSRARAIEASIGTVQGGGD